MVDRLDEVRRSRRAGLVVGRVGDRDPAQRAQVRQEVRIVEDRGDRLAPARLADQREVADREPRRVRAARPSRAAGRARRRSRSSRRRRAGRPSASRSLRPRASSNGGSPGHQTVTGRSWMISGVAIADEVPAGLAAAGQVDRLGAGLGRVLARQMQCASIRASSHDGPSGSADWTTIVRDGWRPVSAWIVAAQRSAELRPAARRRRGSSRSSGRRRGGSCSPSIVGASGPGCAQIRASSVSISAMLWARADQRRTGSPGTAGVASGVGVVDGRRHRGRSDPPPAPAVARDQLVGRLRAPRAGVVVRELGRRARRPTRR